MNDTIVQYFDLLKQQKALDASLKETKQKIMDEMKSQSLNSVSLDVGKVTISERRTKTIDTTKAKIFFSEHGVLDEYMKENISSVFTATPNNK